MKTIFDTSTYQEVTTRLNTLKAENKAEWGIMNAPQMLAHCVEGLKIANGEVKRKRIFIGYILGPIFKPAFIGEKPIQKNSPTDPTFIIKDERNFELEREKLSANLKRFHDGGEKAASTHPHFFFGKFTQKEWGILVYKHIDHHLRQFGV